MDGCLRLSFETVARSASACLTDGDGREVAYADLGGGEAERGLVALLHDLIERHGRPADLAFAAGPGSFTGLRIGAVAARTLAWIERLPVRPVDSLCALAAQHGPGLWWVLLPLKRDTTFHALIRVAADAVETITATTAALDAASPLLHPTVREAIAIGPALTAKPGLAERWCPDVRLGDGDGVTARGVAKASRFVDPGGWSEALPAYGQEPAPVLQRAAR